MLNKVEVRNDQGELLTLVPADVSDGIVLQNIDGLGPVKATLVSSSFARLDGEQFHSSRREPRDLKFTFGLEAMYGGGTVRDIRKRLYRYFMTKRNVKLKFFTDDGLIFDLEGRIESNDPPMFVKEPTMEIVIRCFQPDFLSTSYNRGFSSSATSTLPLLTELEYLGDVESGATLVVSPNRSVPEFTFYWQTPDGLLRTLEFSEPLLAGDVLSISSVPGGKFARLVRGGTISSVLAGISPESAWFQLEQGTNLVRLYAPGAAFSYAIQYTDRYGGL